jgi:LPS export ABC transporter protein LptC
MSRFSCFSGVLFLFLLCSFLGCSFEYGTTSSQENSLPELMMNNVEYTRVRSGELQLYFTAEEAERYEKRQFMQLKNYTFEQYDPTNEEVNTTGSGGSASIELDSGNISMTGSVSIRIDSETMTIDTETLNWQDKNRLLSGAAETPVEIERDDGTLFTGWGFSADARRRTWEFQGGGAGTYVHEDEAEEADDEED